MTLGERIKFIREDLEMSRVVFGETLGVSGDVINNMERDRVEAKEHMLRLICKTHRVNYFWLSEGIGEPYIGVPEIIMDEAAEQYKLDALDKELIEEYVKLEPDIRNAIKNYLQSVFKKAPEQ